MNIYFVRHSKTIYTRNDKLRPLTTDGEILVRHVEDYFKEIKIDKMYSSPFKRAIDTIKGIAMMNNLEIELIEDLRERKVADFKVEDFIEFATNQWNDHDFKMPNGESLRETQTRGIKELKNIINENNNDSNIIIGTHGTMLSVIINYFDESFGYEGWKNLTMPDIILMKFDNTNYMGYEKKKFIKEHQDV